MTMPPGEYYIGDLCYVLDDRWNEVCDATIVEKTCLDGEHALKDGALFAMYGTAHGDGEYLDDDGNAYPVDSGSIGCIDLMHLPEYYREKRDKIDSDGGLGHVRVFDSSFKTGCVDGVIVFGRVRIDTDPEYEADEDEDYPDED